MYHNADFLSNHELQKLGFAKIGKNILISKNSTIVGSKNIFIEDNVRIDPFTFLLCPKGFRFKVFRLLLSKCVKVFILWIW